jgi:hypothetical protein
MLFDITTSNINLSQKPSGIEIGRIRSSINNRITFSNMNDLKKIVLNHAFCSCNCTGLKKENFLYSNIITLDFDNFTGGKEKLIELIKYLNKNDIYPNLIYETYSSTIDNFRFRMMFLLKRNIKDSQLYERIIKNIASRLGADAHCCDAVRMFFPGKKIIYNNLKINNTDLFIELYGDPDQNICTPKINNEYNNYVKDGHFFNVDINELCEKVKIINKFFNDDNVRFSYHLLLLVASNLAYIKGGEKAYKERLIYINEHGGAEYFPYNNSRGIEQYMTSHLNLVKNWRKYRYMPISFKNSYFIEDAQYNNIFYFAPIHKVIIKEGYNNYKNQALSLNQAELLLKQSYDIAKNDNVYPIIITNENNKKEVKEVNCDVDYPIIIIKAKTGLGKSTLYEDEREAVITFATHRLKDDKKEDMHRNCITTSPLPLFTQKELNIYLDAFNKCNSYTMTHSIIQKIANNEKPIANAIIEEDDIDNAKNFLRNNKQIVNYQYNILTTTSRFLLDKKSFNNKKLFIIDEDPTDYIFSCNFISKITVNEFLNRREIQENNDVIQLKTFLSNIEPRKVVKMNTNYNSFNLLMFCFRNDYYDVYRFISSANYVFYNDKTNYYCYCVYKKLPDDKKIIILSSTINIDLMKGLYGNRVKVIDITNVKNNSPITQDTRHSFSKQSLKRYLKFKMDNNSTNDLEAFTYLEDVINDNTMKITYQEFTPPICKYKIFKENDFKLDVDNFHNIYFGNCLGYNDLKGIDLDIIGTFYKNESYYYFIMKILGIEEEVIKPIIVDNKYFKFKMFGFDNTIMNNIVISSIISMTEQASGRNRQLRIPNIKTNVYSNIPDKNFDNIIV